MRMRPGCSTMNKRESDGGEIKYNGASNPEATSVNLIPWPESAATWFVAGGEHPVRAKRKKIKTPRRQVGRKTCVLASWRFIFAATAVGCISDKYACIEAASTDNSSNAMRAYFDALQSGF